MPPLAHTISCLKIIVIIWKPPTYVHSLSQRATTSRWKAKCGHFNSVKSLFAVGGVILADIRAPPSHRLMLTESCFVSQPGGVMHLVIMGHGAPLPYYSPNTNGRIISTSTGQLHYIQAQQKCTTHSALGRWANTLACNIPLEIWSSIWLNFQGACENVGSKP